MARQNNDDILGIEGRVGPLTAYVRNGKKYWRVAHNRKTRRLSRKQLAVRERQSHNNALWRALKATEHVYMDGGENTTYSHFMSINMESPIPYFTKQQYHSGLALLLPNMVISDGPLQPISYQLGEIYNPNSSLDTPATLPALLTDLTPQEAKKGEYLLYVLQQTVITPQGWSDMPYLRITVEAITSDDFTLAPSTLLSTYKHSLW